MFYKRLSSPRQRRKNISEDVLVIMIIFIKTDDNFSVIGLFALYFYKEQNFSSIIISDVGDIVVIFDKIYMQISYLVPEIPSTTSMALEAWFNSQKAEAKSLRRRN